jgi:prevent-host-death family protein
MQDALPPTQSPGAWQLQDAKARFSELVRRARAAGPQRVTVHGRDAVVVLSAEDYARLVPQTPPPAEKPTPSLYDIMQSMPKGLPDDFEFGQPGIRMPVRDVEL